MNAVTVTCDVCGKPCEGGGYILPGGPVGVFPGGWFATNCCGRPGCLEKGFAGISGDNDDKPEGI